MNSEHNARRAGSAIKADVGRTREGNDIWPIDATIRNAMPATTSCRTCRHAADLCTGLAFRYETDCAGKRVLTECSGYEHVQAPDGGLNRRDGSEADGTSELKPLLGEED